MWGRTPSTRSTRFSETEIGYGVKQIEAGISIKEIARKYGVCENTVYRWRGSLRRRAAGRWLTFASPRSAVSDRMTGPRTGAGSPGCMSSGI